MGEICNFNFDYFYARKIGLKYGLKIRKQFEILEETHINKDAIMNAWMGWELINADEAVDIS